MSEMNAVEELVGEFLVEDGGAAALNDILTLFDEGEASFAVNSALCDRRIAQLDELLSQQLDAIMHEESFKKLESSWRGLEYIVDRTSFEEEPVVIELLNASKEDLYDDLMAAGADFKNESKLWKRVYFDAYDLANGHPYTYMSGDFQFSHAFKEVDLLEKLSILCEMCNLPFISNASPDLFNADGFQEVANNRQLEDILKDSPKHVKWNEFRYDDRSKYIGLALPNFLGRAPYSSDSTQMKSFDYTEKQFNEGMDPGLWVNASWAMLANMIRSHEQNGWPVKIVGVDSGGKVDGLPTATFEEHGKVKQKIPFDAIFGLEQEKILSDIGFMPITYWDRTNYGVFHEAASTRLVEKIKKDPQQMQTNKIAAGLQYTMLVTRIAHYLKQRHLRFVGKNASKGDLEQDLRSWLDQYVSDQPNPPESVVAERPIRSYVLSVEESIDIPGYFEVNLELRPHIAVVGADVRLKLVAFHDQEEN